MSSKSFTMCKYHVHDFIMLLFFYCFHFVYIIHRAILLCVCVHVHVYIAKH
jgi:hypothetical protein